MARPALSAVTELLKPITWFPPMWAFACGVIASGVPLEGRWTLAVMGIVLAGPLVCASSQAVNDWFDRHVDAINEPQRPIPSGRMPGRWGLYVAVLWTALSLVWAAFPRVAGRSAPRSPGWCSLGPTARRRLASSRTAGGAMRPAGCATKASPGPPAPP